MVKYVLLDCDEGIEWKSNMDDGSVVNIENKNYVVTDVQRSRSIPGTDGFGYVASVELDPCEHTDEKMKHLCKVDNCLLNRRGKKLKESSVHDENALEPMYSAYRRQFVQTVKFIAAPRIKIFAADDTQKYKQHGIGYATWVLGFCQGIRVQRKSWGPRFWMNTKHGVREFYIQDDGSLSERTILPDAEDLMADDWTCLLEEAHGDEKNDATRV